MQVLQEESSHHMASREFCVRANTMTLHMISTNLSLLFTVMVWNTMILLFIQCFLLASYSFFFLLQQHLIKIDEYENDYVLEKKREMVKISFDLVCDAIPIHTCNVVGYIFLSFLCCSFLWFFKSYCICRFIFQHYIRNTSLISVCYSSIKCLLFLIHYMGRTVITTENWKRYWLVILMHIVFFLIASISLLPSWPCLIALLDS